MFSNSIDVVIKTYLQDVIDEKLIEKTTQPKEFKNIVIDSKCPLSKFANKFNNRTIRTCDGVNTLFSKSLTIKSCADFHFVSDSNTFNSSSPSKLYKVGAHEHKEIQVTPFKFYPKILYPAFVSLPKDVSALIHKAHYHSKNNRVYPSGIISGEFTPNVIFELETNTEDFIEYGEPLLYITPLSNKKIKVHYELITEQQYNNMLIKYESRRFSRHTVG
jgi:hypothetical protein